MINKNYNNANYSNTNFSNTNYSTYNQFIFHILNKYLNLKFRQFNTARKSYEKDKQAYSFWNNFNHFWNFAILLKWNRPIHKTICPTDSNGLIKRKGHTLFCSLWNNNHPIHNWRQ